MSDLFDDILSYIVMASALTSFLVAFRFKNRHKELSHLHIYSLASFIQCSFYHIATASPIANKGQLISSSVHIFIIIETTCIFYFFYKNQMFSVNSKRILFVLYALFITLYLHSFAKNNFRIIPSGSIYYMQSLIVLAPCFIYIFQLFLNPPILNLLEEPAFWFNAGIMIYFILTFPIYFMIDYFSKGPIYILLDTFNYIGYILIFLFLTRAYVCKPKEMT